MHEGALSTPNFTAPRLKSEAYGEFCVACWTFNLPLTGSALHAKLAIASWAGNLNPRGLFCKREVCITHAALQFSRSGVYTCNEDFGTFRTTDFFFHPFATGDGVLNTNFSITKCTTDLSQFHREHSFALGA